MIVAPLSPRAHQVLGLFGSHRRHTATLRWLSHHAGFEGPPLLEAVRELIDAGLAVTLDGLPLSRAASPMVAITLTAVRA